MFSNLILIMDLIIWNSMFTINTTNNLYESIKRLLFFVFNKRFFLLLHVRFVLFTFAVRRIKFSKILEKMTIL